MPSQIHEKRQPVTAVSSIYTNGKRYDLSFPLNAAYLDYWTTTAQTYGDPILEIMCGTGLLSIPLAQEGHQVTGLDLSEAMLDEARRKSAQACVKVKWVTGDVRDFGLGEALARRPLCRRSPIAC